jgi:hypothetical protein
MLSRTAVAGVAVVEHARTEAVQCLIPLLFVQGYGCLLVQPFKCGPVLLFRRVILGLKQGPLPCCMVWSIWLLRAATSRLYAQWLHTMRQLSDGQCVPAKELSWPLRAFIAC